MPPWTCYSVNCELGGIRSAGLPVFQEATLQYTLASKVATLGITVNESINK